MCNVSNKKTSVDYIIYTDGAFKPSTTQGGIGLAWLKNGDLVKTYSKGYKGVTNNKMELLAVIYALASIKKSIHSLQIVTDSMYVVGCATKGWKRKKNVNLWLKYDKVFAKAQTLIETPITYQHVRGHRDNKYNNLCDKLADNASKEFLN